MLRQLSYYLKNRGFKTFLILLLFVTTIIVGTAKLNHWILSDYELKVTNFSNHYNQILKVSQKINDVVSLSTYYQDSSSWEDLSNEINYIKENSDQFNGENFDSIYLAEKSWLNEATNLVEAGVDLASIEVFKSNNEKDYKSLVNYIETTNEEYKKLNNLIRRDLANELNEYNINLISQDIKVPSIPAPITRAIKKEEEDKKAAEEARKRAEEAQRKAEEEAQRKAAEQAAQEEAQRRAAEQAAQEEAQRRAAELAAQEEAQRRAEEAQRAQQNSNSSTSSANSYSNSNIVTGTFLLNTNTGKLHRYPGCWAVNRMKEENKSVFTDTINLSNYDLCGNCF